MIEVDSLVKVYGNLRAVDDVSFEVCEGEVFAFYGPNGAGKTTMVEILECIRPLSGGSARVFGCDVTKGSDVKEIKRRIGVLPQEFSALDKLSVKENIDLIGGMYEKKLDLDDMPFKRVKDLASMAAKQFRLREFLILRSSRNSYHVVFDRPVSWRRNVAIVAWICLMSKHRKLTEWLIMQCIKQASTLGISCKKLKPAPRIVHRQGERTRQIREFLKYRRIAKVCENLSTRVPYSAKSG